MHPNEQAFLNTLQHSRRQHSYLLGRYCAKKALAIYDNRKHSTEIYITNGVFQQPIVNSSMHDNPQVSISHTTTMGAALVFPEAHPMAIDIETIDQEKRSTILTQLTKHELELIYSVSNTLPLQLLWTIKEAVSKVLKCGLTIPFELLEVELLVQQGNLFLSYFKNFPQYKVTSFLLSDTICSIVYPRKTLLNIDFTGIKERWLYHN